MHPASGTTLRSTILSKGQVSPAPSFAFVWLLPIAFILHDGEEVLTMASWIRDNRPLLEELAASNSVVSYAVANLPLHWTEVAGAAGFELLLLLAATAFMAVQKRKGVGLFLYTAMLGGFTLHVVTHLLQALWFGGYTPGLVTALIVIPPASLVIYRRLHRATGLTLSAALLNALVGGLLLLPVVLAAHQVGRAIMGTW
jgi:hypothetical protein